MAWVAVMPFIYLLRLIIFASYTGELRTPATALRFCSCMPNYHPKLLQAALENCAPSPQPCLQLEQNVLPPFQQCPFDDSGGLNRRTATAAIANARQLHLATGWLIAKR